MEDQAPPFFRTGPSPLARLLIFAALSLVLLLTDARFGYLTTLRQAASVIVYPLQRIAIAPVNMVLGTSEFFVTQSALREDKARLEREMLASAAQLQQLQALEAENANLRGLLETRSRLPVTSTVAEVLYAARDPFSRRIIIDKGISDGLKGGEPVVDRTGVVGQITRTYPWLAEVTLITDKDHLVPVLNPRNGLRAVLAGTGNDAALELRFVPVNADFREGDTLVTSGIDGVYPPGLPVATVSAVERSAGLMFARITCRPVAGVTNHAQVLIVHAETRVQERPAEETRPVGAKKGRRGG